jgi:hypothetical protein
MADPTVIRVNVPTGPGVVSLRAGATGAAGTNGTNGTNGADGEDGTFIDWVNVQTDFGAVGDGVTDDTAAIQAAINYACDNEKGAVYFPRPADYYKVSSSTPGTAALFWEQSVNMNFIAGSGVTIKGSVDGYIFARRSTAALARANFEGIAFENTWSSAFTVNTDYDSTGGAAFFENSLIRGSTFYRCGFTVEAGFGLYNDGNFSTLVLNCRFLGSNGDGQGDAADSTIGTYGASHTTYVGCDFNACGTGGVFSGECVAIQGSRIEVCTVGFHLGANQTLSGTIARALTVHGARFEACDTAIIIDNIIASSVDSISIQGTSGAPHASGSQYGIRFTGFRQSRLSNVSAGSGFAVAAMDFDRNTANFEHSIVESVETGAETWIITDADALEDIEFRRLGNEGNETFHPHSIAYGTKSTGTFTPNFESAGGIEMRYQNYTNGGAHTLAPPQTFEGPVTTNGSMILDITNNASAGAITTSGWTKVSGDAFTTTNGEKFRCYVSINTAGSLLDVRAMQ